MDIVLIAHLLFVVLWIGGEAFITMVIFPTILGIEDPIARMKTFLGVERRFSKIGRISVTVVGLTGFWLFYRRGAFASLTALSGVMLGFKTFVWLSFFAILFGGEKRLMGLLISRELPQEKALQRVSLFHWVLIILGGIAIAFGASL